MPKLIALDHFIASKLKSDEIQYIRELAGEEYCVVDLANLTEAEYAHVHVVFGSVEKDMAERMPELRWMQLPSAGAERFLQTHYIQSDFMMTNATGAFGVSISEHILALMLGMKRALHLYRDFQHTHEWKDAPFFGNFSGSTVAVVGLGDIGLETAKRCSAFGARVLAVKRTACEKPDCVDELYFDLDESLDNILIQADFVALCLPHTPDTRHVLDARRMDMMKEHAVIVNIGRGALIDQNALIEQLRRGRFCAGLDVTTPEPLPSDNPLWSLPNCWITPHVSGRSTHSMDFIYGVFVDNLAKFLDGKPLNNLVDFKAGY